MAEYRECVAGATLLAEVNERWPDRDKASDGWIGNAEHAARSSDHNPWIVKAGIGIVRARDITVKGIDHVWLRNHLFDLAVAGDARLRGGGYIISDGMITNADFSGWHKYTGPNAHEHHVHVSFTTNPDAFDSDAPWGVAGEVKVVAPVPVQPKVDTAWRRIDLGDRILERGNQGTDVSRLQQILHTRYPLYAKTVKIDGIFGPKTEEIVREFQRRAGLDVDGVVGRKTFRALDI